MPIEIKELYIKVNIEEKQAEKSSAEIAWKQTELASIKKDIVKTCVQQVLEHIKEKQER